MEVLALTNKRINNEIIKIPFIDLKRQYLLHKNEILSAIDDVLSSGNYIFGDVVESFEKKVAKYLGCKFVLGVANGTDALILAFKCLNIGPRDEVILPTNSFLATAGAVVAVGATPVMSDVQEDLNIDVSQLERLITNKTKAIIPVHLTGRPADMDNIIDIATRFSLFVIEDAAQSIGARYKDKMTGVIGDIGCFSLHPLKNLHIYGDGGLIATNNEQHYADMKLLRNHGLINRDTCLHWGLNSRLDSLQASIGIIGLRYLNQWNERRRQIAAIYQKNLRDFVKTPIDKFYEYAVYHNYIIQTNRRDELVNFLLDKGIETKIHYPVPIHLQPVCSSMGYKMGDFPVAEKLAKCMISLPVYSELREDEQCFVIENIINFYR